MYENMSTMATKIIIFGIIKINKIKSYIEDENKFYDNVCENESKLLHQNKVNSIQCVLLSESICIDWCSSSKKWIVSKNLGFKKLRLLQIVDALFEPQPNYLLKCEHFIRPLFV